MPFLDINAKDCHSESFRGKKSRMVYDGFIVICKKMPSYSAKQSKMLMLIKLFLHSSKKSMTIMRVRVSQSKLLCVSILIKSIFKYFRTNHYSHDDHRLFIFFIFFSESYTLKRFRKTELVFLFLLSSHPIPQC